MKRPYIIIHTHTAIDGSINTIDQPGFHAGSQQYQDIALTPGKQQLNIDAYLNGKTAAQDNITHYRTPESIKDTAQRHSATPPTTAPRISSKAPPRCLLTTTWQHLYYVSIDPHGELAWPFNSFDYADVPAHVIEVLSDAASNEYKDFLRRKEISYIIT